MNGLRGVPVNDAANLELNACSLSPSIPLSTAGLIRRPGKRGLDPLP